VVDTRKKPAGAISQATVRIALLLVEGREA